jgi:hypothetical protein
VSTSVAILNAATVPIAYVAEPYWNIGSHYVPGVPTGTPGEVAGVLMPGGRVDFATNSGPNVVALLGSAEPFSSGARYVSNEGTIPWPAPHWRYDRPNQTPLAWLQM